MTNGLVTKGTAEGPVRVSIDQRYKYQPFARSRPDRTTSRPWTEDEVDVLRREYDGHSATADRIALKLGRTFAGVQGKAVLLGLRGSRSPDWTPTELRILEEHAASLSVPALMRLLPGRSRIAVEVKRKRMHLSSRARDGWYTKRDVCELLGVDHKRVQRYIDSGVLQASWHGEREPQKGGLAMWHIAAVDLATFVRAHIAEFQGRNVDLVGLMELLS